METNSLIIRSAQKSIETIERVQMALNGKNIIQLLKSQIKIPDDAFIEVTFTCPTGGDCSGDIILIDDDYPIIVTYVTKREVVE